MAIKSQEYKPFIFTIPDPGTVNRSFWTQYVYGIQNGILVPAGAREFDSDDYEAH